MIFETVPYFVNELGVKWWPMSDGIWLTELPSGERSYVSIFDDEIVAEGRQLDAVAIKRDLIEFDSKVRAGRNANNER